MEKPQKLLDDEEASLLDPETYARSYQLEALEKAIKENTIVFLETGSGKTLIAVMLLRSYAYMIRKPSRYIAVFLVPTVVLVAQQANVVEMLTDLKVGKFWGEMGVDFWDAATWKEKLEQFEVFVMTPQILLDNLRHRLFKLENIKLLIFDECHRAKGRSPYACIMTEFYHQQLNSKVVDLPRIFGMTASLVDSKGSNSPIVYRKKILELETLMNSKVYTVTSESVLSQYIPFSTPRIKQYKHSDIPLHLNVRLAGHLDVLKFKHLQNLGQGTLDSLVLGSVRRKISKLHRTFLYCLYDLGLWSAAKAAETLSCKDKVLSFWGINIDGICEGAIRLFSEEVFQVLSQNLREVLSERYIGQDLKADAESGLLTTKVLCLVQSLQEYRRVQDLRCIVFVERVIAAIVLESLLSSISQLSGMGVSYMAGNHCDLQSQSRTEQMKIVDAFRNGKVNIIVATQILEEGLDVPSCNLVIRFDLPATVCSFIQSRGRARMQNSDYLLIVSSDDSATKSKVANFLKSGEIMREESIQLSYVPCKQLESDICEEEYYCVESTGALVTLNSSIALIYFYCSRLPSDRYFKPFPRFVIDKNSSICTLYLPNSSPIQVVQAEGKASMLKQYVCLQAVRNLHKIGALTDYLLPECYAETEDEEDIGQETYKDEHPDYFPGELVDSWMSFSCLGLYQCYKISLDRTCDTGASASDIMLVVKSDLGPDFISNSFALEGRCSLTVNLKHIGVVNLSCEQVNLAKRFQIALLSMLIFHDFAKVNDATNCLPEKQSSTEVAYLLLPMIGGKIDWCCIKSTTFSDKRKDILHLSSCKDNILLQTTDGPVCSCMLQNSVIYAPHNCFFYCVTGILSDLNANSSLKLKGGDVVTYKSYYRTRHGLTLNYERQMLLACRHLFKVQNFLSRHTFKKEEEHSEAAVELPPELCSVIMSPISVNTLYSFCFIPSIMHRIQCMLLAARLMKIHLGNCMQNFKIPAIKVLEAITTKKCQEQFSLESLETLGDSFLKYAASQHLFTKYNHHHVGILSAKKDKLISNATLCRLGCSHNLAGYIRTEEFYPKQWAFPGFSYDLVAEDKTLSASSGDVYIWQRRSIKCKTIADLVEALIGAYLSTADESTAFLFIEWLGMEIKFNQEITVERPTLLKPDMFINVKHLEILLDYNFRDPSLLVEALTHGSYQVPDFPICYQRLEFLGDAVLDHLLTIYLYDKYPQLTPGLLTDLRSASVNNDCYAHAAVKAGLNKHIRHASADLNRQMMFYLENFGQSCSGSSYGWEAGLALPKVLGDIIESIAGAIYVDSKCNKATVWKSIRRLLEPIVSPETLELNPVRELKELCSRRAYTMSSTMSHDDGVRSITVEVQVDGTVYSGKGTGPNKKIAKKVAAKSVLECLRAK